ncbi:hypothetical protein [Nesterenkonia flava]|uniref:DUF2798 domain-containing protein n=1 Tax=Nesterenkonia flava TaxID=469799 RepID=A0ABU1FRF9_9MICC|nr:hypothetical protein [Nesterenkonia flava]MDR5710912.1 hypothetical protein [Nesterenkonia flava]
MRDRLDSEGRPPLRSVLRARSGGPSALWSPWWVLLYLAAGAAAVGNALLRAEGTGSGYWLHVLPMLMMGLMGFLFPALMLHVTVSWVQNRRR